MPQVDLADPRRTAETVLALDSGDIPDVVAKLAKSRRLSITIRNLNRLMESPGERELGRRALRHLGFIDA